MKTGTLFALLAVTAVTGASAADGLSYSFVQLTYQEVEIDNGPSGDGIGLSVVGDVGTHVHLFGSYGKFDFDSSPSVESTQWLAGEIDCRRMQPNTRTRNLYLGLITLMDLHGCNTSLGECFGK